MIKCYNLQLDHDSAGGSYHGTMLDDDGREHKVHVNANSSIFVDGKEVTDGPLYDFLIDWYEPYDVVLTELSEHGDSDEYAYAQQWTAFVVKANGPAKVVGLFVADGCGVEALVGGFWLDN